MFKDIQYKILIIFSVLIAQSINGQENFPADYFRSPVDIPIYLSGTFGELRSDHFHTGVDIKTQGVQGKKVFAVADAYVSRIKVSPFGYGKAVYITHPNSYVSVYGHLRNFNDEIEAYVRKLQYERESYSFDVSLKPGQIKVQKGEVIGFSGNTGSSGGPHLHFEIREENTQYPVNPVKCGYDITDNIPPLILLLKLYVMDDLSSINHENKDCTYNIKKSTSTYNLSDDDTITVTGSISFGIRTFDRLNGANNKNGVFSIELFVDSLCIWSYKMTKLSFSQGRYINTMIDYPALMRSKKRIQRSWISPNNHLMIYDQASKNGTFEFKTDKICNIKYVVTDHFGNASELKFVVKSEKSTANNNNGLHKINEKGYVFLCENDNSFIRDDVVLKVPTNALYEDIIFEYNSKKRCKSCLSKIYHIHNIYTPLHKYVEISIKADTLVPKELHDKVVLVQIKEKNKKNSIGGKWENGFVKSKTRYFGDYTIMLDTIPPKIKAINIYPGKKITGQWTIKIRINDELSGIKSFRGTLNDKWILMEYNGNNNLLVYHFDDRILKGENIFKLLVSDNKNNKAEYTAKLFR